MISLQEVLAKSDAERERLAAEYHELCAARDAVLKKAEPVEKKLAAAVFETAKAREKEMALAAEVEAIWGPNWLALKKRIADIARTLGKIPPKA